MSLDLRELNRVKRLYFDPKNPVTKLNYRGARNRVRFNVGKIVENKDPDKLGRVRVEFSLFGENAISDWVPIARPYADADSGFFAVPELKTIVVCAFLNDNPEKPIVLGSLYAHPKDVAPPIKENPQNNIKKFKSKSGMEIVLNDKEGEEQIIIHTKDCKMEMILDKKGGVSIKNELGDVTIDCDTFLMESDKAAVIQAETSANIDAGEIEFKSSKGVSVKSSGNVVIKGSKIKLKGSGITAKGKQIAVKGDMIVGLDMHQIKIPTPAGPQPGPVIPHPFIGDIKDEVSNDVIANNKSVATKGSKGKTKVHMPMGIAFVKNPDKVGTIKSGCIDSVKVNGKAVAVLAAECKTCNDPGPSAAMPAKVLAFGTAVSFPADILGLDPSKYKSTNGMVKINTRDTIVGFDSGTSGNRSLSNARWSKTEAHNGEEIQLEVNIKSYPNAAVYFTVWQEGADRQNVQPIARLRSSSKDGIAVNKWSYTGFSEARETSVANSVIAPKDEIAGIKARLHYLSFNPGTINYTRDKQLKEAVKSFQAQHGLPSDGIPDTATQNKIDEEYQKKKQQQAQNSQNNSNQQDTKKLVFVAQSHDCSDVESGSITVKKALLEIELVDEVGNPLAGEKFQLTLANGTVKDGELDKNGYAYIPVASPDDCKVSFIGLDDDAWDKK